MKKYKPKHTKEEYFDLIVKEGIDGFKKSDKENCSVRCFSVVSQHVYGNSPEECLDLIFAAVKEKQDRIEKYKLLPTLKELVKSNVEIDENEMYYTHEKDSPKDSCMGRPGSDILKMREIGIKEFINESWSASFNNIDTGKFFNAFLEKYEK